MPDLALSVAVAIAVCAVLVRWGVWRWLAVLAAVPAVLAGQVGGGGTPVVTLALAWVVLAPLCWRARPRPVVGTAVVVGVFALGAALLVRGVPSGLVDTGAAATAVLVVSALLALAALAGTARASGSELRAPVLLLLLLPLLLAVAAATFPAWADSDTAPVLAWWPAAGALGLTALLRGRRGGAAARPQVDEVDEAAAAAFRERYGSPTLGPVVIVIAAYNEAEGLPKVLVTLPEQVCGLPADVLVVDDGSSDGTAAALEETRAHAVACPVNRGQGAALRLGYRLAREHGARYVLTTDADGQYDVADLPAVLAPILDGRADFVSGSRILGHQHTHDRVRRTGVHVFAWLASGLTGRRLTDTSFGLRAMRAELTSTVTLNQPQYQSSELLLGALSHGFRVLEVPGTMHVRSAGASKKGRNLVYGRRYAGVMLGTWWREGCPRPAAETAAALREVRDDGAR